MRLPKLRPASRRLRWLSAVLLFTALVGGVQAQAADDASDPPSRVARLSYLAGDVGFLPAGARDWSDASINRPLTTGDRLSTSADARAELELGGSSLRMDGGADFGLLDLDDQIAQIELTQGTLSLSVRDLDAGQSIEIDTPTVALVVDRPGNFRVDVGDGTRDTRISVRDGSATVYGEDSAQRSVSAGRSYVFGDSTLARVSISDLDGDDAFDAWAASRERRYVRSDSRQYVSDQVIGYQDLDQYGDWQSDTDYGAVWYPTAVATDWAPYRSGHWAYIAPWGWSWVDDAPWGFAPYHYGRWAHVHGRWGWIPGPRNIRPVYAPALVAFVGGGGWSVGIGSGPVGWFPLGPGEIYNPWYRASRSYYTQVNITNIYVRGGDRGRYVRDIDNQ
jgi:phage FluMu protein gp41